VKLDTRPRNIAQYCFVSARFLFRLAARFPPL
jgi:hypothetical protein